MADQAIVLGIDQTQDASAWLMRGSDLLRAVQKERLTRRKHHWGRVGDVADLYKPRLPGVDAPIDILVECFSSDADIDRLQDDERELAHLP